ncbi:hypothetical protein PF002_g32985, partial [Phytophthora fragariae]
ETDVANPISRLAAASLLFMYIQLLFFQLKTHADFFEDEQETPEEAAALVSLFSELLVGSIDGFATEMNVSKSFIGIILLPVVGNDVEHVTAVKAALNNKYTVLVPRLRKLHGFGAGANAGGGSYIGREAVGSAERNAASSCLRLHRRLDGYQSCVGDLVDREDFRPEKRFRACWQSLPDDGEVRGGRPDQAALTASGPAGDQVAVPHRVGDPVRDLH